MKKIRLLTVDDDKFIRHLVQKTLRSQYSCFEITEAENGRRAQAKLQKYSFDLVLCDWEMPEMTGLDLLKWVRMQSNLETQPFILVTSLDSKEHVVQAVQAGVSDYIAKPFTPDQLYSKVMKQLVKSGVITQEEAVQMARKERIGAAGGAELLASGLAVRPAPVKKPAPPKAILLQGEHKAAAVVRELNLREVLLKVKRSELMPELASLIQVGLVGGSEESPLKVTLRGYVSAVQLAERNPKTDSLFVRVQFLKQEPETMAVLERLVSH